MTADKSMQEQVEEDSDEDEDEDESEPEFGPCEECRDSVEIDASVCSNCGYDAEASSIKDVKIFAVLCTGITILFPPAAIVTVPLIPLTYFAVRRHDWVAVDKDAVETG